MGEYLLKDAARKANLALEVTSSGISNEEEGNPIDRRAAKVLTELNINTSSHRARQFRVSDFASHDLILAMDLPHYRALKHLARSEEEAAKVRLMREFDPAVSHQDLETLGIYDPWYGDQHDFYETYTMINDAVPGVLTYITRGNN